MLYKPFKIYINMLIYGSRGKQLAKENLIDKCPSCGTLNAIDMYVFQKYAHVFWIPFFPMSKTGVSQCNHCKQTLKVNEMPDHIRNAYENLKSQTKAPVWMFSGLAVVAALITIGVISDKNKDERNARFILTPQSGDVFEIKTKDNQYTLFKVDQVQGDSVLIRPSEYETNRSSGLSELKRKGDNAYSEIMLAFSKDELKKMLDKGEIIDIDRK